MKSTQYILLLLLIILGCQPATEVQKPDTFYHYSIWDAFVNRIFDGTLTAQELKTKGDIALGCYNGLNGELVMVDGYLYQVTEDGVVREAGDEALICFANAAWFDNEQSFDLSEPVTFDSLRVILNTKIPSLNQFYAFRILGQFKTMKCGSIQKQKKPYEKGLDDLIPARPIFEKEDVDGILVGFFCPQFIDHINVPGYHLHFVSNDATFGGHVIDFVAKTLTVQMDYISDYHFVLPQTDEYLQGSFKRTFQYGKK